MENKSVKRGKEYVPSPRQMKRYKLFGHNKSNLCLTEVLQRMMKVNKKNFKILQKYRSTAVR